VAASEGFFPLSIRARLLQQGRDVLGTTGWALSLVGGISLVEGGLEKQGGGAARQSAGAESPGAALILPIRSWIERDGRTYCFVEDYVHPRGKAHITVLEYRAGRGEPKSVRWPGRAVPFCSFPFCVRV